MNTTDITTRTGLPPRHRDRSECGWLRWYLVHNDRIGRLAQKLSEVVATTIVVCTAVCFMAAAASITYAIVDLLTRWAVMS